MVWIVFAALMIASGLMILVERSGVRTTLVLNFKGDVKRETRWIAQYGQALCTIVAIVLVLQLDRSTVGAIEPGRVHVPFAFSWSGANRNGFLVTEHLVISTIGISLLAMVVKRLVGRVRPNREGAGQFLGPTWKHANYRESFPSSHSANAVAMSAVLAMHYPAAGATFWTLAIACACLRYVLDAHWPSDVIGGVALGYLSAVLSVKFFG